MWRNNEKAVSILLAGMLAFSLAACGGTAGQTADQAGTAKEAEGTDVSESAAPEAEEAPEEEAAPEAEAAPAPEADTAAAAAAEAATADAGAAEAAAEETEAEEVYILFTSDVHCGVDQGFGYAGLEQVRDTLEEKGFETILVDDGDATQGEPLGTFSKGETIIELMNAAGYDVAIPGNHEFDYGMDQFLALTEKAEFPYISCNFTYQDELVFAPYIIKEAAGKKIGFVGVTTPTTIRSSTPAYFQDENGEYIYSFKQDDTGEELYQAVQEAADAARADGADYVYLVAHLGNEEACSPWNYADVVSHTSGIDVVLDGHSHDTDQVVMKNKNGEEVTRSAVGTKMACIGYSHITADGIEETGIWSWPNDDPAPELLGIHNTMSDQVEEAQIRLGKKMDEVIGTTEVRLTIHDPEEVDESGNPIRMVRRAETNLGDLCADAYRDQSGADIAIVNGGAVRDNLEIGDITYGDVLTVQPFGNMLCVIEVSGQQILDALEWGCHSVPGESGGFMQVSGLTYEINVSVDSTCTEDENGMCTGITGERRVQNVMVGDEPLDPDKTYTLAGSDYVLQGNGDGLTAFDGAPVLRDNIKVDCQVVIDYIKDTLGGVVGEEYADPYGQGRIVIVE